MRADVASSTPRGPLSLRLSLRVDSICGRLEDDRPEPLARPDPVAISRRVDAICEGFEEAWRLGEGPRIEDHLPAGDDPARPHALRELVALERELRCGAGEPASPSEYRARFPDDSDLLADVLDGDPADVGAPEGRPRGERTARRHARR